MVCLGNICRSPLAQGIFESKVTDSAIVVDSAGTGSYHIGSAPDMRSIQVAQKNGIAIGNQKARQFSVEDFSQFSLILVMDKSNYADVIALAPNEEARNKVHLILPNNDAVPDPYYGGIEGFEYCYSLIDEACDHWLKKIRND